MPTTVLATRFNNLQQRISKILGTSSSATPTFGYGQTYDTTSVLGNYNVNTTNTDLISASDYENLYKDIARARVHQVGVSGFEILPTPVGDFNTNPNTADKIQEAYISYLEGIMNQIEANKFEIGSDQFAIESLLDTTSGSINVTRLESVSSSWNGTLSHIFTVTFLSERARRHFFNAGGKIRMSSGISWPFSQAKTNDWKTMLSNMGAVNFGATGASSANGVGSATSIGNYNLNSSYQLVYRQTGSAYSGSAYEVYALQTSATQLQFRIYFRDITSEFIDEDVFGDLTSNISIVRPEGSVVYNGAEIITADISTPPVGQNIAVFNGVVLPQAPTISAYWSPTPGTVGSTHRVYWSTTNATSVQYNVVGPNGVTAIGTVNVSGNLAYTWTIPGTATATLTAVGPGGTDQSIVTSQVNAAAVVPTYAVGAALPSTLNEGQSGINYGVSTSNVAVGTVLYWNIEVVSGIITAADFQSNTLSGSVSLSKTGSGGAFINRVAAADSTTEGSETFRINLYTDSEYIDLVAQSDLITIADLSTDPITYQLTANNTTHPLYPNLISEGTYTAPFTVTTTNVPNGTILYWTTTGAGITASDFTDNTTTGSVTINNNTATISRSASADLTTEGAETFTIQLRTTSYSGLIVATSAARGIVDTSTTIANPNPQVTSLSFSPTTVQAGQNIGFSWTTSEANSTTYTISLPNGTQSTSSSVSNGSASVTPTTTGTLSVSLRALSGAFTSAVSTINAIVTAAPVGPAINSFTVSPSSILTGGNTVLTWTTSNATTVTYTVDGGAPVSVGTSGSETISITPIGTSQIVLTAFSSITNTSVTSSRSVIVNQIPLNPTVDTFGFSPSNITAGASSSLYWTTSNATSIQYSIPGIVGLTTVGTNGVASITFPTGGDYTASIAASSSSSGTTATDTASISVAFPPAPTPTIDTFSFSPSSAGSGLTTLTWATTNAGSVAVSVQQGVSYNQTSLNGSLSFSATNGDISAGIQTYDNNGSLGPSTTASFTYIPVVAANSFDVSPSSVGINQTITASISGAPGTSYTISAATTLSGTIPASGSTTRSIFYSTSGTKTITCSFSSGSPLSASGNVTVLPSVPTPSIAFNNTTLVQGAAAAVAWSSGNATSSYVIWSDPNGTTLGSSTALSGSQGFSTNLVGSYNATIDATNIAGTGSYSNSLTVTAPIAAPTVSVYFSPSSGTTDDTFTAGWTVTGNYTSITATQTSNGVQSSLGSAPSGSFSQQLAEGTYSISVIASGPGGTGSDSASATVAAALVPPPVRGTPLDTTCLDFDLYGIYADGNGGSYQELIEANSSTCGYEPAPSVSVYFTPGSGDTSTVFSAGWLVTGNYTSITATQISNGVQSSLGSAPSASFSQTLPAGTHNLAVLASGPGGLTSGSAGVTVSDSTNATGVSGGGTTYVSKIGTDNGTIVFSADNVNAQGQWFLIGGGDGPVSYNASESGTNVTVTWYAGQTGDTPQYQITATWTNSSNGLSFSSTVYFIYY
tara:strand:+ start:9584 stop:14092 length:4509 start_codon:yes stop_codon:yes gene_type:complete